jgi:hypothetical protein
MIRTVNIERKPNAVQAVWQFELDWLWEDYTAWVIPNLEPRYQMLGNEKNRVLFRRSLEGDVYNLEIQRNSVVPPLHIQVLFVARPV